ncbi:MAG: ABC transporter substrate-binding protein [Deltaproteobacteria bacterium]|nr:ABC transporter substrate-binding protein [Deltaproteobacteria bacterium]
MEKFAKGRFIFSCVLAFFLIVAYCPFTVDAAKADKKAKPAKTDPLDQWAAKPNDAFDVNKMSDMSDYDPGTSVVPTGDTIKLAVVVSFSGPASIQGLWYYTLVQWVAHDINKRGGIWVDGKKKLIQVIKADHLGKPDTCKKVCERMALQEKVHAFIGSDGSHHVKIMNETANKYKIISVNLGSMVDELQDAKNFSRYAFHSYYSVEQSGRALAYYFGQISKKEKKFYILNQDYSYGRALAAAFKKGLQEYHPEGQIVGEDYHKLFLTDFAPYLTKVKASGADIILSGDFLPDGANLAKQAYEMKLNIPFANIFMNDVAMLRNIGVEGTKGFVRVDSFDMPDPFKSSPSYAKYYQIWKKVSANWKAPYDTESVRNVGAFGNGVSVLMQTYWLLSVMERAKSTDPEKIIKIWEGDTYRYVNGKVVKIRACDHKAIMDLGVSVYVPPAEQKISMTIPPYYWFNDCSYIGPTYKIPAAKILPWMDQELDRCSGKTNWGE